VGLEPSVGFLFREFVGCQTKQSLVYDLQEPFRWIADVTVMEAFESCILDLPDFYFTGNDYRYRFQPEAKQRFLKSLREQFNSRVKYNGCGFKWDTVIQQKIIELSRYLTNKITRLTFNEPLPILAGEDSREVRAHILSLRSSDARQLGIGKSTMHYLRNKSGSNRPFRIYPKIRVNLRQTTRARGRQM
jgi:CRISPR-associated protein Cas1